MTSPEAPRAEQLSVIVEDHGGIPVVHLAGELDVYTAEPLRTTLGDLASGERPGLVVDLTGLAFMDSSGLGVLIGTKKQLAELSGDLAVVCVDGPVLRLLSITGLVHVLSVQETVAAAVADVTT